MLEGCSPEPAGGLLEVPGDGVPRWMVVGPFLASARVRITGSGLYTDSFALVGSGACGMTRIFEVPES